MVIERTKDEIIIRLPSDTEGLQELIDQLIHKETNIAKNKKLELLRGATTDPLFLADVNEIHQDFDSIDQETL